MTYAAAVHATYNAAMRDEYEYNMLRVIEGDDEPIGDFSELDGGIVEDDFAGIFREDARVYVHLPNGCSLDMDKYLAYTERCES